MAEASFGGSVPQNYNKLLVPLIFEDYADDLVSRVDVPSGGRVLEIACGTGVVTRKLRAALADDVELVATDINPDMQAVAVEAHDGDGIVFEVQDGTALTYDDDSFDTVVCQYGVMFYPDKTVGYREALRVLKPGGRFIFNVWDSLEQNPLMKMAHEITTGMLPPETPPFLMIPFGYFDIEIIQAELSGVGFSNVDVSVLPKTSRSDSARTLSETFATGTPLAPHFVEMGVDKAIDHIEGAIREVLGDGPIEAPMQAIVFEAEV